MTSQGNADLLDRFYAAFAARDGDAMAACYGREATFDDPVFVGLRGDEPGQMWRMLTRRAQEMEVDLLERAADDAAGTARWVARYTFGQTGRRVSNDVRSAFTFRDGLIATQRDEFDFPAWAKQALGTRGLLLGRTRVLQKAVQRQARAGLDAFVARTAEPEED